jgi:hypothetical protein
MSAIQLYCPWLSILLFLPARTLPSSSSTPMGCCNCHQSPESAHHHHYLCLCHSSMGSRSVRAEDRLQFFFHIFYVDTRWMHQFHYTGYQTLHALSKLKTTTLPHSLPTTTTPQHPICQWWYCLCHCVLQHERHLLT